jgi:4-hydroxy-tetrahydrodipicolinate reductase
MLRILLSGCNGKMGKILTEVAKKNSNLIIAAGVDSNKENNSYPVYEKISKCTEELDVILDFSRPSALNELLDFASINNTPLVLCTTGYSSEQLELIKIASSKIPVFRSANMSIGINVINNILKNISELLYKDFDIEIIEKHHNEKVDAPSGTALLLANTIKEAISEETVFINGRDGIAKRTHKEIGIHAIRGGNIVGDHQVIFAGQGEIIEIKHTAISRDVFAVGALTACKFIFGKEPGMYSMSDILK